jgi:hypothetical protein
MKGKQVKKRYKETEKIQETKKGNKKQTAATTDCGSINQTRLLWVP